MKNFSKILAVICVIAVLCVGVVFTALAVDTEPQYTGTVEELSALVAAIDTADEENKDAAIVAVADYLEASPVDPAAEGYDAQMAVVYAAVITRVNAYMAALDEYEQSVDPAADEETELTPEQAYQELLWAQLDKAAALVGLFDIDESTEGFTECATRYNGYIIAEAEQLLAAGPLRQKEDGYWTTATHGVALNKVSALLKSYPLFENEASAVAFAEKYDGEVALQAEKQAENRELSYNGAAIDEYELSDIFFNNFDDKQTNPIASGAIGNLGSNFAGIEGDDANHYYTIRYLPENTADNKNTFMQFAIPDATNGIVLEFDVTTFDKIPPNNGKTFSIEGGGTTMDDGTRAYPLVVYLNENGDLCDSKQNILVKDVLTPGEWLHLTVVHDPDRSNFVFHIYLNDEYVGTCDAAANTGGNTYDWAAVRFNGSGAGGSGEFSVDNIVCYQGTSMRDGDKLSRMTEAERYAYYCEYYLDESRDAFTRLYAAELIEKSLDAYWDRATGTSKVVVSATVTAELKERIDAGTQAYLNLDPTDLIAQLKEANKQEFIRLVTELSEMPRTPGNVSGRKASADAIIEFRALNGANMDQVSQDYKDADNLLVELQRQIGLDTNAVAFGSAMARFEKAETTAAKERYINMAKDLMSAEQTYPISDTVYEEYSADDTLKTAFDAFIKAYERFEGAQAEVDALIKVENSKRIIYCIDLIKDYTDEAAWEANYDYINEYILIIRRALREGNYDPDYESEDGEESIEDSLKLHAPIEAYFYGKLQQEHRAVIREKLDKIAESDQYIEKMGMVSFIERYLAQNAENIEEDHEEMVLLLTEFNTYKEELVSREEDYESLLQQNAYYFVRAVSNMVLCQTYTEQVAYYEEATLYYFALDARVEGVNEMIEIYDAYAERLASIEEASVAFVESVLVYQAAEGADARFDALVDCYAYSLNAEITYEGVAEAMEIFTAAYDEYMAKIDASNSEIYETVEMMASIRANSGAMPVISVALKLLFD